MDLCRPTKRAARHFLRLVEDRTNGYSEKRREGCDLIAANAPTNHSTQNKSGEFRYQRKKIHKILKKTPCSIVKVRNARLFDAARAYPVPSSRYGSTPRNPNAC
jgi:hypothetical protein